MNLLNIAILSIFLLLISGCSDTENSTKETTTDVIDVTTTGDGENSASYKMTFTDQWRKEAFPINFPSSRHFSNLIGGTHNEQVIFWESGQVATVGIQDMAESGKNGNLNNEVTDAINEGKANQVLKSGGIGNSPSSVSIEFNINRDYPLVTLVSMVAPSPDWFVGVNSLNLLDGDGKFVESLLVPLAVYDAGTDSGVRFTSSNSRSEGEVITRLSCLADDCDFLNGVHRDPEATESVIGHFFFERTQ